MRVCFHSSSCCNKMRVIISKVHSWHWWQRGGQNKMGSGCMLLTMKSMYHNTCFNEKRPGLLQETSGTMFFKSRPKFFLGISKKKFIRHTQCTKNDHYFKSCHYRKTKKVLKSIFLPIEVFPKTLKYQLFLTQMPLLLLIFILVNYFQWKMSDSRLKCQ